MVHRYNGWIRVDNGLSYLLSPDKTKIAYRNGKTVELTWVRWVGGGTGPKEHETTEDYVRRRFSGSLKKRDVRNLASVLENLEEKYRKK